MDRLSLKVILISYEGFILLYLRFASALIDDVDLNAFFILLFFDMLLTPDLGLFNVLLFGLLFLRISVL